MTRLWREGCGIALWAMNFIYRLAAGGGAPSNAWGSPLFYKTFTTALAGGENALPPLVAGATTFPSAEAVGLWVLSNVPHDTEGKRREAYSAP